RVTVPRAPARSNRVAAKAAPNCIDSTAVRTATTGPTGCERESSAIPPVCRTGTNDARREKQSRVLDFGAVTCDACRMSDLHTVLDDLRAEGDDLDALVATLPDENWALPTPAEGWTIAHQIGHL